MSHSLSKASPSPFPQSIIRYHKQLRLVTGVVRLRFVWTSAQICVFLGIESFKLSFTVTLITDIVLLLVVLVGLLRLRSSFPLERLLWNQGVLWLLLAIVAEVPPVVFIILDINSA